MHKRFVRWCCLFLAPASCFAAGLAERQALRSDTPPRKVIVASACVALSGSKDVDERVAKIESLLAEAVTETRRRFPGERLDLFFLPENALRRGTAAQPASAKALTLDDPAVRRLASKAAKERVWLVLPMILAEKAEAAVFYSNAAVLIDRSGSVAGIYRKTHPTASKDGDFENGITPGRETPVFETDFCKLGIQICWDMSYEEGWDILASRGAELVVMPSMSPQNVRLSGYAQRHRYWVVNSTPRDNVTVFNPIGLADAQRTEPGVLVHRFDLASAVVHWNAAIEEGRAFSRRFGKDAGYSWSRREDTGLFWSNDPQRSVGSMLRELGIETMDAQVERIKARLREASR